MRLQVSLKLKLSKQRKKIKLKYNTFEKATFDEYLVCALALRTINEKNRDKLVGEYIDDVTGDGSLNAHLNTIYHHVKDFNQEQLKNVMKNSMLPILKIDERNRYDYYPQLNASIFNNQVYQGDLGEYADLPRLLMIKEEIIDKSIENIKEESTKPDQYIVLFHGDNNIEVKLLNEFISIDNKVFEQALCIDLNNIGLYKGLIHSDADGDGWKLLTNATLNSLLQNGKHYYECGDHYLVRNDSVRKTMVSNINGLYIYKEENFPYQGNPNICNSVLDFMNANNILMEFNPKSLVNILKHVNIEKAQNAINAFLIKKEDESIAMYGMFMLVDGLLKGWRLDALKVFAKYATAAQLNFIYQANSRLSYSIEQLIKIDYDLLSPSHKNIVEQYNSDLESKRNTVRDIIGDVTTMGLCEKAKNLESDDITRKFSELCNRLIGHVKNNLYDASLKEVDEWLKDALKLQEYASIIRSRLK